MPVYIAIYCIWQTFIHSHISENYLLKVAFVIDQSGQKHIKYQIVLFALINKKEHQLLHKSLTTSSSNSFTCSKHIWPTFISRSHIFPLSPQVFTFIDFTPMTSKPAGSMTMWHCTLIMPPAFSFSCISFTGCNLCQFLSTTAKRPYLRIFRSTCQHGFDLIPLSHSVFLASNLHPFLDQKKDDELVYVGDYDISLRVVDCIWKVNRYSGD